MPLAGRKRVISLLLFLVLSASTPWAQQFGRIIGEAHVNRSDFPGRVLVELRLRGAPIASTYTDEQGKFGFAPLSSNIYHVVIRDERFYPVDERVALDVALTSTLMVQIHLSLRQEAKARDVLSRGSGSNPNMVDTEEYQRRFPKSAVKEFDKGVKAERKGKLDDAIRHYENCLTLAPDFYRAHNNVGSAYLSKSNFQAAQTHFEQAIRLNQSDAQARLNLANAFLQTKRYEDALNNVEEGLRRAPDSAFGQFLLGTIYERLGRFPEAEQTLRQALELDASMSKVHLELVNLYLAQNKRPEATAELHTFLKAFPNDPMAPKVKEVLKRLEN